MSEFTKICPFFVNIETICNFATNTYYVKMVLKHVLGLSEIAEQYHVSDVYGEHVAAFSTAASPDCTMAFFEGRISFYLLLLLKEGRLSVEIGDNSVELHTGDLLILSPFQLIHCQSDDSGIALEGLMIDSSLYASMRSVSNDSDVMMPETFLSQAPVYHLDSQKATDLGGLFHQVRTAIRYSHLYKAEIIRSLVHVCLLFIVELPYDSKLFTHDFKHKENIFKIFMHLATMNFREERQVVFYADKLNMTPTYLSRTVREISGATVSEHLSQLAYKEACNLLRSSDLTMGEISDMLHFHDQSAFTNFFKAKAGMTPQGYRNQGDAH